MHTYMHAYMSFEEPLIFPCAGRARFSSGSVETFFFFFFVYICMNSSETMSGLQ